MVEIKQMHTVHAANAGLHRPFTLPSPTSVQAMRGKHGQPLTVAIEARVSCEAEQVQRRTSIAPCIAFVDCVKVQYGYSRLCSVHSRLCSTELFEEHPFVI